MYLGTSTPAGHAAVQRGTAKSLRKTRLESMLEKTSSTKSIHYIFSGVTII